jgi:hypothetical protein
MLNIPAMQADDDSRMAMLIGAVFSSDDAGRRYIEHLHDAAWVDAPDRAVKAKKLYAAAEAGRGHLQSAPDPIPEIPANGR